ncbi:MAG: YIP1 family protein [Methanosarcinales archaeon]|nr:MAG: YIP1 family protein [Methanosarcinales archaeon]
MSITMVNLLTNPDRFFADLSGKDPDLRTPAAIVLLAAIATGIHIAAVSGVTTPSPSGVTAPFTGISVATGIIGGLIIMSVSWFLFAGVFYAISTMLRGVGSFRRVLEFTGYGFIPAIIAPVIGLAAVWLAYPGIDFSTIEPQLMKQTLMQNPLMKASDIAGIIFLLWSSVIWIFGVKHACNVSRRTATVTVVLPVAVYLLYSMITIIGS